MHQAIAGKEHLGTAATLAISTDAEFNAGSLALLLGARAADGGGKSAELSWSTTPVNETSLAYFAAVPSLRVAADKRLAYFMRFLEHDDAAIADDAYQEFGHAAYEDVGKPAASLPYEKLRPAGRSADASATQGFLCIWRWVSRPTRPSAGRMPRCWKRSSPSRPTICEPASTVCSGRI